MCSNGGDCDKTRRRRMDRVRQAAIACEFTGNMRTLLPSVLSR
ncbi:Uncharacterised protein [Xylophilus ampelinus]|nr:Uncharacterised protein [Xylophilus ampelinus]